MSSEPDSGYQRLESQIAWHDKKSISNQRWFKTTKVIEIIAAAGIPFVATHYPPISAMLGILVVVLEGIQHIFQYQSNWMLYRSTCEALKHEKYLFLAEADIYVEMDSDTAKKLLARRVESLISTEHAKWLLATKPKRETK